MNCSRFLGICLLAMFGSCILLEFADAQQSIRWRYDYDEARKEAKQTGKPIFIEFTTNNCFWCKKLESTTFRDPTNAQVLRQSFIPVKIHAEKYRELVKNLGINRYPTLVLARPDGKILDMHVGYMKTAMFRDKMQNVLAKFQPTFPAIPSNTPPSDNQIQLTSAAQPQTPSRRMNRAQLAKKLMVLAKEEFRTKQYVCCLTRCKVVTATFPDLPEATQARHLILQIKNDPEKLLHTCNKLTDSLCELYIDLANTLVQNGQKKEAVTYLEWVIQACSGTRHARTAQEQLQILQGNSVKPSARLDFRSALREK